MELKKPLVVIPTYNEKGNIGRLVDRLLKYGFSVLVIDDNSPDGTGKILDGIADSCPEVSVIHRAKKLGLGTAYIQGFKWALDREYGLIFSMDADFSHNPEYLPVLVRQLEECDVVIGSRYVPDGGVRDWPAHRRFISRAGNFYAKTVLGYPVNDSTSGFMGYRRTALEALELEQVDSEGYGFLIEMKYRAYKKGFKIFESPIIFTDRTLGKSKISKNIIWEALFLVWRLKIQI